MDNAQVRVNGHVTSLTPVRRLINQKQIESTGSSDFRRNPLRSYQRMGPLTSDEQKPAQVATVKRPPLVSDSATEANYPQPRGVLANP
ncbi:hypothetical protein OG792_20755 [Micromonospora sp. NBC_01699]|uniref:hypothetical protein n=1 Tax=Micromonospora sp. NBC_01699 TaxID=2975984 RepID=UPI002E2A933D|nr:hypothetical protein [Micromonospora sp. NBC_01699]